MMGERNVVEIRGVTDRINARDRFCHSPFLSAGGPHGIGGLDNRCAFPALTTLKWTPFLRCRQNRLAVPPNQS